MRKQAVSLPQLSVHTVELLIAHAELAQCFWRSRGASDAAADVARCQAHLLQCSGILKTKTEEALRQRDSEPR